MWLWNCISFVWITLLQLNNWAGVATSRVCVCVYKLWSGGYLILRGGGVNFWGRGSETLKDTMILTSHERWCMLFSQLALICQLYLNWNTIIWQIEITSNVFLLCVVSTCEKLSQHYFILWHLLLNTALQQSFTYVFDWWHFFLVNNCQITFHLIGTNHLNSILWETKMNKGHSAFQNVGKL